MRSSILSSIVLHLAIMMMAIVSLPIFNNPDLEIPPIVQVELIEISEKTNVPKVSKKKDKKEEKKIEEKEVEKINQPVMKPKVEKSNEKVKALPDGSGSFTTGIGANVQKDNLGFGLRSWRYAIVVNDGVIESVFSEDGFRDDADTDPYEVSSPENVLNNL